jgi:hypothetical protein
MYAVRAVGDARPYAFFHMRRADGRNVRGAIAIAPYDLYVMYIVRAVEECSPPQNAPTTQALSTPITPYIIYYTQKEGKLNTFTKFFSYGVVTGKTSETA